jgi:hypothetical protein
MKNVCYWAVATVGLLLGCQIQPENIPLQPTLLTLAVPTIPSETGSVVTALSTYPANPQVSLLVEAVANSHRFGQVQNQTTQPYFVQLFIQGDHSTTPQILRLANPIRPGETHYFANPYPDQPNAQFWLDVANSQPVIGTVHPLVVQNISLDWDSGVVQFDVSNTEHQAANLVTFSFCLYSKNGDLIEVSDDTLGSPLFSGEQLHIQHALHLPNAVQAESVVLDLQARGIFSQP